MENDVESFGADPYYMGDYWECSKCNSHHPTFGEAQGCCGGMEAKSFAADGYKGISAPKIEILEWYVQKGGKAGFFHDLPTDVQIRLQMGYVHELLEQDVNRWLQDHGHNPHMEMPDWLSAESFNAEGKCYKCGVSEKKQKLWWAGKKGLVCGICSEGGVKYRAEVMQSETKNIVWAYASLQEPDDEDAQEQLVDDLFSGRKTVTISEMVDAVNEAKGERYDAEWVCSECGHRNDRPGTTAGMQVIFDYCHKCKAAPKDMPFFQSEVEVTGTYHDVCGYCGGMGRIDEVCEDCGGSGVIEKKFGEPEPKLAESFSADESGGRTCNNCDTPLTFRTAFWDYTPKDGVAYCRNCATDTAYRWRINPMGQQQRAESFSAQEEYLEVMVDSSSLDNLSASFGDGLEMEVNDIQDSVLSLDYGAGGDEAFMPADEAEKDYMNQIGISTYDFDDDNVEDEDDWNTDKRVWRGTIHFPEGNQGEGGKFYARVIGFTKDDEKNYEEQIMNHILNTVRLMPVRYRDDADNQFYYAESFSAESLKGRWKDNTVRDIQGVSIRKSPLEERGDDEKPTYYAEYKGISGRIDYEGTEAYNPCWRVKIFQQWESFCCISPIEAILTFKETVDYKKIHGKWFYRPISLYEPVDKGAESPISLKSESFSADDFEKDRKRYYDRKKLGGRDMDWVTGYEKKDERPTCVAIKKNGEPCGNRVTEYFPEEKDKAFCGIHRVSRKRKPRMAKERKRQQETIDLLEWAKKQDWSAESFSADTRPPITGCGVCESKNIEVLERGRSYSCYDCGHILLNEYCAKPTPCSKCGLCLGCMVESYNDDGMCETCGDYFSAESFSADTIEYEVLRDSEGRRNIEDAEIVSSHTTLEDAKDAANAHYYSTHLPFRQVFWICENRLDGDGGIIDSTIIEQNFVSDDKFDTNIYPFRRSKNEVSQGNPLTKVGWGAAILIGAGLIYTQMRK